MKFYDTHFEDYLLSHDSISLHPKLSKFYKTFPNSLSKLQNIIFYGPKGVGKYTQMLNSIRKYSPTDLKYEKKISVSFNKNTYFFKISDIHFEIDLSLLGCNSKLLWNQVYNQIIDIILAKSENIGIIVCKNFQDIHSELLELFYSYMQTRCNNYVDLKFILITEQITFIPSNIINRCYLISIPRPTRTLYNKCLKNKVKKHIALDEITNMKSIIASVKQLMRPYEIICTKIIEIMIDKNNMKFAQLREHLYDIFIYNLDITDCIFYILDYLIISNKINSDNMDKLLCKTVSFLQYYNNNYRPIYHLESYIFYLISIIHGFHICM
jgi:hypothetical protein